MEDLLEGGPPHRELRVGVGFWVFKCLGVWVLGFRV